MTKLKQLFTEHGQSPWLDNLSRAYLRDGTLARRDLESRALTVLLMSARAADLGTVRNIPKRAGLDPAPRRDGPTWDG